eukprot:1297856-Amphidinium_carterae.1
MKKQRQRSVEVPTFAVHKGHTHNYHHSLLSWSSLFRVKREQDMLYITYASFNREKVRTTGSEAFPSEAGLKEYQHLGPRKVVK